MRIIGLEYSFSLPKTIHYKVQGEEKVEFSFQSTVERTGMTVDWKTFFSAFCYRQNAMSAK